MRGDTLRSRLFDRMATSATFFVTLGENFGEVLRTSVHERKAYKALLREGLTAVEGSDLKAKGEITSLTDDIEGLCNDHS